MLKKRFNSGQQCAAIVEWSGHAPSSIGRLLKTPRPWLIKSRLQAYSHQVRLRTPPTQVREAVPCSAAASAAQRLAAETAALQRGGSAHAGGESREEGLDGGTPVAAISIAREYGPFGQNLYFSRLPGILLASVSLFAMSGALHFEI